MVTFKVLLDKRRPKKNLEFNVVIRITHNRVAYSVQTGVYNENFLAWIGLERYDTPSKKATANSKLNNDRLYFNANQILYLIVKEESEIDEIIAHIREVKGKNYTMHEVDRLTTRILSCERIIKDF